MKSRQSSSNSSEKIPIAVAAWRLLRYRARLADELRAKLLERGYQLSEINELVNKLEGAKVIDDQALVKGLVNTEVNIRRQGTQAIYWRLVKRGLNREAAKQALELIDTDEELEAARSLLTARAKTWQKLDQTGQLRRAMALLARRGYSPNVVRVVIKEFRERLKS